ncbi:pantetheine-phosphate adenylyltransferase [Megalodesulfovibrio gigas]|uniref:Phosphopantetheine adenylyltransferase n=2 Tax=Megalodesulfovibrio gigas TaxID=879 RepID=T2G7W2_MEGG1|nr:pantetheine-phosphate adenylyltransferase [Megalodesulfovibrio gigas]AAW67944.1 putative phosphopantetheine adenylyltransferase [Megalodesulfovibrio gigas]AGW11982.1 putative phosphopantetheine adenylyltransferase [Megalodesulfovibrio gigas DSM 1382 = ATCC 19364]
MDTHAPAADAGRRRVAIYPGTFDPLTFGHVSLVKRALDVFDHILVAPAAATPKTPMFSLEERVEIVREVFHDNPRVEVAGFQGLLVEFARRRGACAILRGLRAVSDFEYEFQMALMNRRLEKHIQTVFLMTDYRWLFISSTIVKEAAKAGADVRSMIPDPAWFRLQERLGHPVPCE